MDKGLITKHVFFASFVCLLLFNCKKQVLFVNVYSYSNSPQVSFVSASVNTPYGKASSSWKIKNNTFNLDIVIPPNTTADIQIPYVMQNNLLLNGSAFKENLNLISSDKHSIKILTEPGTYNFKTKL
jgi:alpha-L-rhamnosidase